MSLEPINHDSTTVWPIRIYPEPLADILERNKKVEGRVPDPSDARKQYGRIQEGDIIHFILRKDGESMETSNAYRVVENTGYDSIEQMLKSEGIDRVVPRIDTIQEGVELYESFGGYKRRCEKYGIYAIELGAEVEIEWEFL